MLGTAALVAAVLGLTAPDAAAFGRKKAKPAADCGGPGPACYADQVVTTYKPVWKCKKVEVDCVEHRWVEEPYKYKVCKVIETKVPCQYTTYEWRQVKDTVKVCKCEWKERPEPYTTYEPQYTKTKVKKIVYDTVCVPTEVPVPVSAPACDDGGKRRGLFARLCGRKKADCAAPCPPPCGDGCGPATQIVMKPTRVPREVECEEVVCKMVPKPGVRNVKYLDCKWVDQEVLVWKCVPVVKDGFKTVCTPTWVDCDGVRKVCKPFQVKKWVDQPYCEWVKCDTVVKVPVPCGSGPAAGCGGCGTPAPVAVAADCGSGGKKRGGLFARLCGKKDDCN
jgi:hypothetical protein